MKYISVGQSALRIVLETGADLTAEGDEETGAEIRYEKPDGSTGCFTAFILDADKGVVFYDVQDSAEIDQRGWWLFWAFVRFADGRCAAGRPVRVFVHKTEGTGIR